MLLKSLKKAKLKKNLPQIALVSTSAKLFSTIFHLSLVPKHILKLYKNYIERIWGGELIRLSLYWTLVTLMHCLVTEN